MLGGLITTTLVLILGYAYPAFECFKTIERRGTENAELRFWCQYWVLIAIITVFERIADLFVSWVPMYYEMKLALIIYLWYPKTKGTGYVYETLLRPFLSRHETDIERHLNEMRTRAWDVAIHYWNNSSELGQAKFFEILQYIASQPTRPRSEASPNYGNSGDRRPPPPPPTVPPTSAEASQPPQSDQAEERWIPTAPPMPNVSRRHPVNPGELDTPESPSGPQLNPGTKIE
ncbi:hypothetical protein L2E82_28538 [Cichorium intybus]|uniref:Uncharacterized protein n=1 Tax=Cichorium intybus TaxID=13427 RepID=A0ACB9CW06_CICIN|nr:hypothetical protein L2E82_28538 [Cichorium intybus]